MTFSFGMLAVSVCLLLLFPEWSQLEAYDARLSSSITLGTLVCIVVFGALSVAHLVTLVVRKAS